MCPAAEKLLGTLAEREGRIVPIAFHVDYFNNPWKDVFSDHLYSQRQMNYNELYTKPKNPEYGLYYTPMMMIDGQQSVNGRDAASAEAAIRQALLTKARGEPGYQAGSEEQRACRYCRDQGDEPVGPGRENASAGLRRSTRRQRRHRNWLGRKCRQITGRALSSTADEIRLHRARRQLAGDPAVYFFDRARLEAAESAAGRLCPEQADRCGLSGGRCPLAIGASQPAGRRKSTTATSVGPR